MPVFKRDISANSRQPHTYYPLQDCLYSVTNIWKPTKKINLKNNTSQATVEPVVGLVAFTIFGLNLSCLKTQNVWERNAVLIWGPNEIKQK